MYTLIALETIKLIEVGSVKVRLWLERDKLLRERGDFQFRLKPRLS